MCSRGNQQGGNFILTQTTSFPAFRRRRTRLFHFDLRQRGLNNGRGWESGGWKKNLADDIPLTVLQVLVMSSSHPSSNTGSISKIKGPPPHVTTRVVLCEKSRNNVKCKRASPSSEKRRLPWYFGASFPNRHLSRPIIHPFTYSFHKAHAPLVT